MKLYRKILRVLRIAGPGAVLALTLMSGVVPSGAQTLFRPALASEERAATPQNPALTPLEKRSRIARVDASVLSRHIAPMNVDEAVDRTSRAKNLDGIVTLNLFTDVTATFRRTDLWARDGGGYIWEGEVTAHPFHEALLLVRDGSVSGRVQLFNRIFRIDRLGAGLVRITELDQTKFPAPSPPVVRPLDRSAVPIAPRSQVDSDATEQAVTRAGKTPIRLLVVYTTKAKKEAGGRIAMADEIDMAIASANQAFARSDVPAVLRLAGKLEVVGYTEGNDLNYGANLNALAFGAIFAPARAKRDEVKADLVSLFRAGPDLNNCPCQTGLAFFPGGPNEIMPLPSALTKQTGFSVVGHKALFDYVLQHELGHNFGLNHDRYQFTHGDGKTNPSNANYNFGYTNLNKKIYTIMSYFVECESQFPGQCAHVNYYSSPTILGPGGARLGVRKGLDGAADNARRLKETFSGVAAYE